MAAKSDHVIRAATTKPPPYTVEASGFSEVDGETIPRRNVKAKDALWLTPEPGIETVYDILKVSAKRFGNAKALGSRKILRVHEEVEKIKKTGADGKEQTIEKRTTYPELSNYHYMSFIDFELWAIDLGAGLRKLGMTKGARLHMFAATSPQWLAMAHGKSPVWRAITQSMPIVTSYETLGEDGFQHSLCQGNAKAIFLDPNLLPKLVKPLKQATNVQFVIYNEGEVNDQHVRELKQAHPHLTILSIAQLRSLGEQNAIDPVPPHPDDLCCIMYTSGSTGTPKGVLLKHKNVIAAITGADAVAGPYIGPGDGLLTYLPPSHILEFMFENASLYWGATMGYATARTLTAASVRNCKGDLQEFAPSIMVGVPAVWESVKKGIMAKVNASLLTRMVFWTAMSLKSVLLANGLPGTGVLDALVFNKIKTATGGRLKLCMNGGGPIAKSTLKFVSLAITPMINGYGLSETAGMGTLNDPAAWNAEALGEIPPSVEMKLVDVPDLGYRSTNDPPQGEIWIRGGAVTEGYLDLEDENKESFHDGWFKTGDIGEFDSTGQLKIIDRKKNLVKTLNGEYIALEKLESLYRSAPVVANICVYAAEDKAKPIAIIVPAEPALKKLALQNGIDSSQGLEALASNPKVNEAVLKEVQNAGRAGGLNGIEIIAGVVIVSEEWTPQNGLVTSAQKLNRRGVLQRYREDVNKAYKNS